MTSRLRLTAVAVAAAYVGLMLVLPLHGLSSRTLLQVASDVVREIKVGIGAPFARQRESKAGRDVARP